jgi:hypothetical protein
MQLQACAGVQRGSFLAGTLLAEHERKLGLLRVQLGAPAPARHKRHGRETAPPLQQTSRLRSRLEQWRPAFHSLPYSQREGGCVQGSYVLRAPAAARRLRGGRVRGAARRGAAAAAAARAPAGSSSAENRKKNMHPPWHAPPPLRPISCQRPPLTMGKPHGCVEECARGCKALLAALLPAWAFCLR